MIKKIAFSYYCVSNMDRAADFYQNTLEFKLLFKKEDWSEFEVNGQRIALHKTGNKIPTTGGAVISLQTEAIEDVIKTLKNRGVRFVDDLQIFPYGKLASFLDPDDNLIGLYQPPEKSND